MKLWRTLRAELGVLSRAKRNRTDLQRWLIRRPALLAAVSAHEAAFLVSNRCEPRLKVLGALRASTMIGCPF
jgi:hypothetical protein